MNATELATLPLDERLRAMETLWDSICRDAGMGWSRRSGTVQSWMNEHAGSTRAKNP